jgi:phosphoribosylamine--glycine ligase
MTVVYASRGYPGPHQTGSVIGGLDAARAHEGVLVFQAGTRLKGANLVSNGGRVLNVTGSGRTLAEARARAYDAIAQIDWPEGFFRKDIGWRVLGRPS